MTNRKQMEIQVVERALKDAAFKQALLKEPRRVLESEFGAKFDANLRVTAVEVGPDDVYIVLPVPPPNVESIPTEQLVAEFGADDVKMKELAGVVVRAWKDPEFKRALSGDPATVIERELGEPLPDGVVCHVLVEDAESQYLLLPALSADAAAEELSDERLEAVAGGWAFSPAGVRWSSTGLMCVQADGAYVVSVSCVVPTTDPRSC